MRSETLSVHKSTFLELLNSIPDRLLYDPSKEPVLHKLLTSKICGGSVLQPVGRDKENPARVIQNNLQEKIINFEIEYLYGGGYYEIERLIDTKENRVLDIFILLENVANYEDIEKLRTLYDIETTTQANRIRFQSETARMSSLQLGLNRQSSSVQPCLSKNEFPLSFTYNDIKESLNGIARIVIYNYVDLSGSKSEVQVSNDTKLDNTNLKILRIEEGTFKNGNKHGFCRVIDNEN